MSSDKVTARPWEEFDAGHGILHRLKDGSISIVALEVDGSENARHIVKCVNNHERLVEALEKVLEIACEANFEVTGGLDDCISARNLIKELDT